LKKYQCVLFKKSITVRHLGLPGVFIMPTAIKSAADASQHRPADFIAIF
jgi:hypothetical protein